MKHIVRTLLLCILFFISACDGSSNSSGGGGGDTVAEGTALTSLTFLPEEAVLDPAFDPNTTSYSLTIPEGVNTAGIIAEAEDGAALSYTLDGTEIDEITVQMGLVPSNTIQVLEIIVTNGDISSTYTIGFGYKDAVDNYDPENDDDDDDDDDDDTIGGWDNSNAKLIISSLCEPSFSPAETNKYIVITNIGTSKFKGNSDWKLYDIRDFSGSTPAIGDGDEYWSLDQVEIDPGCSISFGDAASGADKEGTSDGDWNNGLWSKETDGAMIVNGTTIIDAFVAVDGTTSDFENTVLLRKVTVLTGVTTSDSSEWIQFSDFQEDFPIASMLDYRHLAAYSCESKNASNEIEADTSFNNNAITWGGNKTPDPANDLNFVSGATGNCVKVRNIHTDELSSNWLEFTIESSKINLYALSLNIKRDSGFGSAPSFSIRTSADSYNSSVYSSTINTDSDWEGTETHINLSSIGEVSSSITVRLYFYGETCDADNKEILLDNIIVFGHAE